MMDWLTEGPLSRIGGSSPVAAGARAGAPFGPAGMAIGALGGWLWGRIQSGRLQAAQNMVAENNANFGARQSERTDFGLRADSPLAQFSSFGRGQDQAAADDGNIGADLGITDWGSADSGDSEGESPRGHRTLKEIREAGGPTFALSGVSNFMVGGQPVINGSHGYGAFGGSGQGYFKNRRAK